MVSLKKLLVISSCILLAACAQKFDPVEHSRVVDVRHRVDQALKHNLCADPVTARQLAEQIDSDVAWLVFYSQHIPKNESMERMAAEVKKTTAEFAQRYQTQQPSRVYCELKLKNISAQITVIQQTNARRAR